MEMALNQVGIGGGGRYPVGVSHPSELWSREFLTHLGQDKCPLLVTALFGVGSEESEH